MQHSDGTVYATPCVAPAHGSVGLGERPQKFNRKYFKRWQQKMLFYLTTLNLARFLQEDAPDLGDNPDRQTVAAMDAWKHSNFLKYKTEDAGSRVDFKMVDSKTVISQVQEFQLILHDIHTEGMVLGESFQVAALIEKLSPTWKDFKNYLKHKRKEMKLEDLIVRLRIEEDNRQSEKKAGNYHQEVKANMVKQGFQQLWRRGWMAMDWAGSKGSGGGQWQWVKVMAGVKAMMDDRVVVDWVWTVELVG
ncbi:hypothetical protein RJ639_038955 [Escallonia herrerae]|uniref:Uncharacterized protein n=1 Tax=Escallonia herrerae TaxID=1293975 RepID=A0AA88WK72_9ASTE|nr:hypothetical protein RJ639_038955 [Escallonia herrerae]